MAVITPDTFDPLRRYVGVRLQQGVPIVDADWNELEDVRKFEVRAFLKWFVGDGVAEGNEESFRIEATGVDNDFTVRSGVTAAPDALDHIGRCIVDGVDVMIEADATFRGQPLHASQPGSAALSAALGVPEIPEFSPPGADGRFAVYLDVWERIVSPTEDPTLVLTPLGTESCARTKREWVVRVRPGPDAPQPGDPDHDPAHSYYVLAWIDRRGGVPAIEAQDVTDRRERNLLVPPATLIRDLLGMEPEDYRRGLNRPAVSLREAINALLLGNLPATAPQQLSSGPGSSEAGRGVVEDLQGNLWAFFESDRTGNGDIYVRRYLAGSQAWGADERITTDAAAEANPLAIVDDASGDVWVFWNSDAGAAAQNVWSRRYRVGTGAWDAPVAVSTSVQDDFQHRVVKHPNNSLLVYFTSLRDANTASIFLRRFDLSADAWDGESQVLATPAPVEDGAPSAAVDSAGEVFVVWEKRVSGSSGAIIVWNGLDELGTVIRGGGTLVGPGELVIPTSTTESRTPEVMVASDDTVRLFWRSRATGGSPYQIQSARFDRASDTWVDVQQVSTPAGNNYDPRVVEDAQGKIWVFWRWRSGSTGGVRVRALDPTTGLWGDDRLLAPVSGNFTMGPATRDASGAIWVFWAQGSPRVTYHKRLVTQV